MDMARAAQAESHAWRDVWVRFTACRPLSRISPSPRACAPWGAPHLYRERVPDFDHLHVERLRAAGAISIGKTTVPELGWKGTSHSPVTGITHNPWRLGMNAGGSSAGAAVCAAAGIGPIHQGSDGAGSIRMPAAFCGVYRFQAVVRAHSVLANAEQWPDFPCGSAYPHSG